MGSKAVSPIKMTTTTTTTAMMTWQRNTSSRRRNNKIVVMGGPKFKGTWMKEKLLSEMIAKRVEEAQRVCHENKWSDECKVAWDEVEEISRAKADLRLRLASQQDPLEPFCRDHPEADECRLMIHDDNYI